MLTKQLSTPTSGGKSITAPPPEFDTVGSIADAAGGLFAEAEGVFNSIKQKKSRRAANERAQRSSDRAEASEARAVFNHDEKIKKSNFEDYFAKNQRMINKTLSAAKQGKIPQTSADIQMEKFIAEATSKFPDQEAELLGLMKENGLDHYLVREQQEASQLQDVEFSSQKEALEGSYKFAADRGLIDPNVSLEDGAAIGRKFQFQEEVISQQERQLSTLKSRSDLNKQEIEIKTKQLEGELSREIYSQSESLAGPVYDRLKGSLASIGTPEEYSELQKSAPAALAELAQAEMQQKSRVAGHPAAMKAVEEVFGAMRQNIVDVTSGDFSQAKKTMRDLQVVENTLKVNLHRSAPVLMRAKAAGLDMATIVQAIPPNMQDALRNEMLGFTSAESKAAVEAIESRTETVDPVTGEITKARKDITELPGPTAINRAHIETAVHSSSTRLLVNPSPVPEANAKAATDFLESGRQLELLAERAANTQDNLKSRTKAVNLLTAPGRLTAYQKLLADPDNSTQALNNLTRDRVTLKKMLDGTGRHVNDRRFSQGFFSEFNAGEFDTFFNKDTGRYEHKLNPERTDGKGRGFAKNALKKPVGVAHIDGTVPRHIQDKVSNLNKSLDFLMQTNEQDPELKGFVGAATDVSVRNFLVSGDTTKLVGLDGKMLKHTPPPAAKLLPGVEAKPQKEVVRDQVRHSPYRTPDKSIGKLLDTAAEKHNVPPAVFHAMAEAESGGQKDRATVKSGAGAVGVMQITPIYAEEYGYDFKDMTKPSQNIEASADGFADLIDDFNGDIEDALLAYNAGPTRVRRWIKKGRPIGGKWQNEAFPYVEKIMGLVNSQPDSEEEEVEEPNAN